MRRMERVGRFEHRVPRVAELPAVDSGPDIAPLGRLQLANGGGEPLQATLVRVCHDGTALHVRFECEDRDVWATRTERDSALWEEEVVEVFLAPGDRDPTRYFEFEVNPLGAVFDAIVHNPQGRRETMRVDPGWDCAALGWGATAEPGRSGWRAWLQIPWAALSGDGPTPSVWRANFYRIDRPRSGPEEFTSWSPTWTDPPDFHKPARFGFLRL